MKLTINACQENEVLAKLFQATADGDYIKAAPAEDSLKVKINSLVFISILNTLTDEIDEIKSAKDEGTETFFKQVDRLIDSATIVQ